MGTDNRLQLGYGSAWHMMRCLGFHRKAFSESLAKPLGADSIDWLDFVRRRPKQTGEGLTYGGGAPVREAEWEGLDFLSEDDRRAYGDFWPTTGTRPNWDAVGFTVGAARELVLIEAKGNLEEISSRGTTAKPEGGRGLIETAFKQTIAACGHSEERAGLLAETWLTTYYQYANRLATLHFLLSRGVPSRMVFVYFCGDATPGKTCPKSPAEWATKHADIVRTLGLRGDSPLEARVHNLYIDLDTITGGVLP